MYDNRFSEFNITLPEKLKILILANNELISVPKLPDGITHVDLSNNKITEIHNQDFPESLEELKLNENYIRVMPNELKSRPLLDVQFDDNCLMDSESIYDGSFTVCAASERVRVHGLPEYETLGRSRYECLPSYNPHLDRRIGSWYHSQAFGQHGQHGRGRAPPTISKPVKRDPHYVRLTKNVIV
jgi:hypothetical protein